MDFDSRYRGEMIRYAAQKYGDDHVAQIITFSTIKARAAVRDAARVLGYPYVVGDKIAKLMPPLIMGRDTPLHACFEPSDKYADGYKMADRAAPALRRRSRRRARRSTSPAGSKGLRRQDGIHAAAVVITREPLTEYLPIQRKPEPGTPIEDAPMVTQYEMHGVEDLGLLKMDFLGLRNLDVMEIALDLIERSTGDAARHRQPAARRPEDLRAVAARPTRSACSSSRAAPMRALLRSLAPDARSKTSSAVHRAVPAGPDGAELAQRVRRPQERPQADHVRPPRPRGDPRPDLRADDLPRAADARVAEARRLLARRGRQPAQGDRQEDPRADREGAREVRRGLRRATATPRSSPRATSTRSSRSPTTRSTSRTPSATASSRTRPRG